MSSPVIINCEQGTEEWHRARMGVPTASEFATVMASGKGGGESKTRKTYMLKLAGEVLTNEPAEAYSNIHMERGKVMEDEARDLYAFTYGADLMRVGFVKNHGAGCSPDSLIGEDGGLEIKTALPHIQIERLLRGDLPPEHRAQVQGSLWVTGRQWWDFVSYWPRLPLFCIRVHRDEEYISGLAKAVAAFNIELLSTIDAIRSYSLRSAA